jgi:hypothetical protein
MSTIESNLKNQPIASNSASSSQSVVPPPSLLPTISLPLTSTPALPLAPTTSLPSSSTSFYDDKPIEKLYKKPKQILFEFDQIVKGTKICFFLLF